MLDQAAIAARIPHAGRMCLLSRVCRWDETSIDCIATSHRDPDNPLRERGQLASVHGIEYAAQAMALHAVLIAGDASTSRAGYIGAVREVVLHALRLDQDIDELLVHAERLVGGASHALYGFSVRAGERVLVEGRVSVALDVAA